MLPRHKVLFFEMVALFLFLTSLFLPLSLAYPVPTITVSPLESTKTVAPDFTASFILKVKSLGDNATDIVVDITYCPPGWTPYLSESNFVLQPGDEKEITFSVTPSDAEVNVLRTVSLKFTAQFTPIQQGTDQIVEVPVELQVNVRESSTPGFEFVLFCSVISIMMLIMRNKIKRR